MSHEMQKFVGTKIVLARAMNLGDYNVYRGWPMPANENPAEEGFLVEYPGTAPNMETHKGYVSWSPKAAFDDSHTQLRPENGIVSSNPIMQFFTFAHLPAHLQGVSKLCALLAQQFDASLPDGAEKSAGLRKLLEAKDCFVRSTLAK